jgi:hypothetical protein
MLKHRVDNASSDFMIVNDQSEIIDVKRINFWNIQLLEKQLINDYLCVFIDVLIDHKIERNENCFLQFQSF